jgi:cystathionine beta-lyase/cystathionine gamma-synthase
MSGENSTLVELGEIKGQLKLMTQMLQQNHDSTNQRIDDLRHSTEARTKGLEDRVGTLEKNERGTAVKAGVAAAIGGVIVAAGTAAIRLIK